MISQPFQWFFSHICDNEKTLGNVYSPFCGGALVQLKRFPTFVGLEPEPLV